MGGIMLQNKWPCILLAVVAAGCSTSQSKDSKENDTLVPNGVTAAFTAEHPYAEIKDPKEKDQDDMKTYIIPYTLPDGSKGQAVYTEAGVLIGGR
jgi:hypothetical protein